MLAVLLVTGAAAAQTTLNVVWMGWEEDQVMPLMDAFEREYPDIRVNVERMPFGEIFQALEVRLAARTSTPDVYLVDGPLTGSYAARGHLLDLTDAFASEMDRFVQAAIDQGTYQGRLYSAPFISSMGMLFYNVDMFEEAGITPPPADVDGRWTWEQVAEAARKLSDPAKETWGLVIEQSDRVYQILPIPQSKGAFGISDDGLQASGYVDSDDFVEAMEFYSQMFTEWKASPPGVFDSAVAQEYFGNGKAAMFLGATWNIDHFEERYPSLNWGIAPHPYFEGGTVATPTGSWHIGVNPRTAHQEEAIEFVKFLTSDEMGVKWFGLRPYVPVQKEAYTMLSDVFDTQAWQIVLHELDNTAVPRPRTPGYREYEDIMMQAFRDIQLGGDVRQTLRRAASELDLELEKYRQ